ncbi:carboxyl transferase domain-containing protein [Desulfofundulus thermocisternus]|uniref:carboxyl transferase domain-containing protein n=1 Tax=Desulfofundulus thermocisternus TaxID=42471 RepID=UPI00217CFB5B|nr:carboxyl transferase domain-containing protein [Desulfofundulus thermocisternus]MCS5694707.1 hypothetical protein [Desulfofundulus thermocisternus]
MLSEYRKRFINPYNAASLQHIDDVIEPAQTRGVIVRAFEMTASKRLSGPMKKHGNIPL